MGKAAANMILIDLDCTYGILQMKSKYY